MSFVGKDGKRYYRFYNAEEHGAVRHKSETELMNDYLVQQRLFTLKPLVKAIRQACQKL